MTPFEFIVEMQWTFLLLVILLPLIIGMIASPKFRADILNRKVSMSPIHIGIEPTATAEALKTATATDEELTASIDKDDDPAQPEDVTAIRREAVQELVREAVHYGHQHGKAGASKPPSLGVAWNAKGGPQLIDSTAFDNLARPLIGALKAANLAGLIPLAPKKLPRDTRKQDPPEDASTS